MSWQGTEFVRMMRGVDPTEKAVAFVIGVHQHHVTGVSQVSVPQIALEAGISERQCIRVLNRLEFEKGKIRRAREGNGRGSVTRFELVGLQPAKHDVRPPGRMTSGSGRMTLEGQKDDTDVTPNKEIENQTNQTDQKQHGKAVLSDWMAVKRYLENKLPPDEYRLWLRPMYLLKDMGGTLLLSLPPNEETIKAARANKNTLLTLLRPRGYQNVVFTAYPSDSELQRAAERNPDWNGVVQRLRKKPVAAERTA